MSSVAAISDEAHLFVLGDEGILFLEDRQELLLLNTTATFVWCCLEEGLVLEEIVRAYEEAFDVGAGEAATHVAAILDKWQGLGHISGLDEVGVGELDFTAALGRLLASSTLRAEFSRMPRETVRRLRVRATDVESVLSLTPSALDEQVKLLAGIQWARRHASSTRAGERVLASLFAGRRDLADLAAEARLGALGRPANVRVYRLLSATVRARYASSAQLAWADPALAHLQVSESSAADTELLILEGERGHVVVEELSAVELCTRLDELAPLMYTTLRRLAAERHRYFVELHAGVVSNGERCILFPAAPGSGKTTLTAALSASGFTYFSDELAFLEEDTLRVRPVPLALTIKPGSVDLLEPLYPGLRDLPVHHREDGEIVRYLPPPTPRAEPDADQPVGWIVFPSYDADVRTELRPMPPGQALQRLMLDCLVLPERLNRRRVERLVRWMRGIECFELPMSSLTTATELLRARCAR